MTFQQSAEIWAGFVGSQSPAEFMEISREQGHATVEEAVAAYVNDIPNMFGQDYSAEALEEITDGLTAYLHWHGYN